MATLHRYHITAGQLRWLDITIILPLAAIWGAAFYGYHKLSTYSRLIRQAKDGRQIAKLTKGVLILVLGLPLNSIISQILKLIGVHHTSFTAATAIVANYVSLVIPLVAFAVIGHGARGLSIFAKQRPAYAATQVLAGVLIVVGVLYGYFISLPGAHLNEYYHLKPTIVLITLVIPYIYTWFLGLLAAYELHLYSRKITGVIYRQGWDYLAYGLGAVIITSILLQYFTTLTMRFQTLSLGAVLAMVYGLLAVMAVGYVLLSVGAKKLTKIEEV